MRPLFLRRFSLLLAWLSLPCASLSAAAAPASQSPPDDSNRVAPAATLRTTSNLVLVDVVVVDRDHSVHGLTRGQFQIFDNGRPQTIVSFEEHAPVPQPAPAAFTPPTLPPDTYTNLPLVPPDPAFNVLLLDGLNTTLADQLQARRQMLLYLKSIKPGTPLAIFTLSSGLRMISGFTTHAAALGRVVQRQSSVTRQSAINDPETAADLDTALGEFANMGGDSDVLGIVRQFETDLTAFDADDRVRITLDAMQQLARYLSAIPGRKNLIWFSGSFPISLDPDDSQRQPFAAMRDYAELVTNTDALLSSARVAVYPVDARALLTPPELDVTSDTSTNLVSANVSARGMRRMTTANRPNRGLDDLNNMKDLMKEQASMNQIAQETGGQAYLNTNGLKDALADAIANGSSYYTVGYVPAAKTLDGKFHSLRVRITTGDYHLAYRSGYLADSVGGSGPGPLQSSPQDALILAATALGAPPSTQILFNARVLPSTDPRVDGAKLPPEPAGEMAAGLKEPTRRAILDLKVDSRGLQFTPSSNGELHARVEFVLVAYSLAGVRVNYLDRGFQVNLNSRQLSQARAKGFSVRFALDLPSEPVTLRIAVHDLDAARIGSLEVPFPMPAKSSPPLRAHPGI
jgi:VWFA-related protein